MANLCKENTLLSVDLKGKMHFSLPSKKRTSNNKNPFKGRRLQTPLGLYLWKLFRHRNIGCNQLFISGLSAEQ